MAHETDLHVGSPGDDERRIPGSVKYTPQFRASGIALAVALGPVAAAEALNVPRTTVSGWMHSDEAQELIALNKNEMGQRLWMGVQVALESVLAGLVDPKQKLSDRARALEVLTRSHALVTGQPTDIHSIGAAGVLAGLSADQQWSLREMLLEAIATDEGQTYEREDNPALTAGSAQDGVALAFSHEHAQGANAATRDLTPDEMARLQEWCRTPEGIAATTPEERARIRQGEQPRHHDDRIDNNDLVPPTLADHDEVVTLPPFPDDEGD